jgi:hypothetical protein
VFGSYTYGNLIFGSKGAGSGNQYKSALESAAGADTLAVDKELALADASAGADALVIDKELAVVDVSTGADVLGIDKELIPSDGGVAVDTLSILRQMSVLMARDRSRLKPAYLLEISLKNGGPTLYFSDRNIEVSEQKYEDYLEDLSGIGEEIKRATSEGINADITLSFKNDRFRSYSYLIEIGESYPFEGAEVVIKEVYLDDDGVPSDVEVIFKGVLDEPKDIDLMGFKCSVSSMEFHKDRLWKQEVIDTTGYPNAYEDVGKYEPIVYGSGVLMPALRVDWGARTTLKGQISASATSLELSDASRFPASGYIWIDEEKIYYLSKSGNVLDGLSRGQGGTTATAHRAGADVWEHKAQYDSLLAGHELYSVGDIFAEIEGKLWRVTSGVSAVYEGGKHLLRATEQIRVKAVEDEIDVDDTTDVSDGIAVSDDIEVTVAGATKTVYPDSSTGGDNPGNSIDGNEWSQNVLAAGETNTVGFPDTSYGTIDKQYVYAILNAGDWSIGGFWTPSSISASQRGEFRFQRTGGDWGDPISFTPQQSTSVYEVLYKEVEYTATTTKSGSAYRTGSVTKTGTVLKTGTVISTHTVDRFHAVVSGYKDPDGNYGGAGSLIERPDYVIKHFLVERMGFSLSGIDTASFDTAGSFYATKGYKFAFAVNDRIVPSEFLRQLAFECRSTLRYEKGRWYLDVIPDTAPESVKTITKEELAGKGAKFRFRKTPWIDIANDLTAKFKKNYSRLGSESEWDSTVKQSDSASQAKYGIYPEELEFEAIRDAVMADDVLSHILLQRKTPLLVVEFPVFWEHFDLKVGDTIQIDNPLYGGKKFYIESIRRFDKFRAEVRAIEWW